MIIRFAVAALLVFSLTACAGSGNPTGGSVPTPVYVRNVCQAMVQWNEDVGAAFQATEERPDTNSSAVIRTDMLDFFDDLQDKTDAMRARVEKAARPDVPDGVGVARELRDALTSASAELAANRTDFAAIPLTDVQPAASIEAAMTVVGEQLEAIHASVGALDGRSPDLRRAREREPACKQLQGQDWSLSS